MQIPRTDLRTFWHRFFSHPLIVFLAKEGHSIERLTLYCLIHHDHHFFLCSFLPFPDAMKFDSVRRLVEEEFDDLYLWLQGKRTDGWRGKIITLAMTISPAHEWSTRLAGIETDPDWRPFKKKRGGEDEVLREKRMEA